LVVVLNVVPRSVSLTVTFAPDTTAPEESRTLPTMLPMSFCAQATPATKTSTAKGNQKVRRGLQEHFEWGVIIFLQRNLSE
jgi:hypothetical protein